MKRIIYTCDYCGKEITGDVFTFRIAKRLKDGMDFSCSMEGMDPDLCADCIPAWLEAVKPNLPEAPKKKAERKPLDMGKVLALRNAGWSLERIDNEMNVSPQTIANRLAKQSAPPEEEDDE